jgi:DNA-binding CsgD family transcriptional regulator
MRPQELMYARQPRSRSEFDGELQPVRMPIALGAVTPLDMKQVLVFPAPSEARLRALFELTAAEARLARHLSSGDTLEEIAERLSIKLTTARSQLAVIFSKTGIRRQSKLVAILSRIAHLE